MRIKEKIKLPLYLLKGINTSIPDPLHSFLPKHQDQFEGRGVRITHGRAIEHIARSAYTTWLRNLVAFEQSGLPTEYFSVGEIGPGDSFSAGLAAMLTGADQYYALDVVDTALNFPNGKILDFLVELFGARTPIPDNVEFPKHRPRLNIRGFPKHILTDERLRRSLAPERIERIRSAIERARDPSPSQEKIRIQRIVGWYTREVAERYVGSMDLIMSTAAMEHVDDVESTYSTSALLLRPHGIIGHAIDYKCHDTASQWNGQLTYGDRTWKIIRGKSVFFINRYTHSLHLEALAPYFDLINDDRYVRSNELNPGDLAPRFRHIPESDLVTSESFIIARKRPESH